VPKRPKRSSEPNFDVETRVLRAVIVLAERLSFTEAARKLHISQPALSKQIAELEERFGFRLFAPNLVQCVRTGELNLALVTAPENDDQITAVPFARAPLYVALLETHAAARSERIALADIETDNWILFSREVHPIVHDAILAAARCQGITPKTAHDIMGVRQAIHLVSEGLGVAILSEPLALEIRTKEIVVKPISDTSLFVPTCLVMRADDKSPLIKEFAHAFLSRFTGRPPMSAQLELFRSSKDTRLA